MITKYEDFLSENYDIPAEDSGELVFSAETRGGRYALRGYKKSNEHGEYYELNEYTRGSLRGSGTRNTVEDFGKMLSQLLQGSAEIDGINYVVSLNRLPEGSISYNYSTK